MHSLLTRSSIVLLLNITLLVSLSLSALINGHRNELWKRYPDSYDYLHQSRIPLTDPEFWIPEKKDGFSPRAFMIPFVFKVMGQDPELIIPFQKLLLYFSCCCLVFTACLIISNTLLKVLLTLFIYTVFSWWNIFGWTDLLLSESLTFSFFVLWLGSLLYLINKKSKTSLILHLICATVLVFSRDTWLYVLLFFYFLFLLKSFFFFPRFKRTSFTFMGLILLFLPIQQIAVKKGERFRLPFYNNLAVRILQNEEYVKWFENKGLPDAGVMKENLKEMDLHKSDFRYHVYKLYNDKKYESLNKWIQEKGSRTYMFFLLTHPGYTLLQDQSQQQRSRLYVRNLYEYTREPYGVSVIIDDLFPVISYIALFLFTVGCGILFLKTKEPNALLLILVYLALVINAVLIYNADSLEVERHLFFNSVFVEILGALTLTYLLDNAFRIFRERMKAKTAMGIG